MERVIIVPKKISPEDMKLLNSLLDDIVGPDLDRMLELGIFSPLDAARIKARTENLRALMNRRLGDGTDIPTCS